MGRLVALRCILAGETRLDPEAGTVSVTYELYESNSQ